MISKEINIKRKSGCGAGPALKKILSIIITLLFFVFGFFFFRAHTTQIITTQKTEPFSPQKVILIPGFMESLNHYDGLYHGLDIWGKNIDPQTKIDSEFVVGHSLGGTFALINWEYNKNTRVILVNPVISKLNKAFAIKRWTANVATEGFAYNETVNKGKLFGSISQAFDFLSVDSLKIMKEIPKDNLTVLCGMQDQYFCDNNSVKLMQENNINVIVIPNVGHGWSGKIDEEIKRIVNLGNYELQISANIANYEF